MAMASQPREGNLIAWQWRGYAGKHRDRVNLLIHLIAVPAFIAGVLAAVTQILQMRWIGASISLIVAIMAFALQGIGHKREASAPEPFAGAGDFFARVFAEQFITFPRFVLSGQWASNLASKDSGG